MSSWMGAGAIGAADSEFTHPGDEGFGSLNPRRLDLPCDVPGIWSKVAEASTGPAPTNVREFTMMIASWGTIEVATERLQILTFQENAPSLAV